MERREDPVERLQPLLSAMLGEGLEPSQAAELGELLKVDPVARRQYLKQVITHAMLQWSNISHADRVQEGVAIPGEEASGPALALDVSVSLPALVLDSDQLPRAGWSGGSLLVSYAISALLVVLGLLIASQSTLIHCESELVDQQEFLRTTAKMPATVDSEPDLEYVARVTNGDVCRWSDPATEAYQGEMVPVGQRYALASGLLEITYQSGTTVILEGPCDYEAVSSSQGYLTRGKVTVRVATTKLRSAKRGDESLCNRPPDSGSSPPAALSGLFAIRTPTALVTDLGTEFAVEVEQNGTSRAHVFQGKVGVRPLGDSDESAGTILRENESARVVAMGGVGAKVIRETGCSGQQFVRKMSKRVPIQFFGTGQGLKPGDWDAHWQVVARATDKTFQPQRAVVFQPIRLIPRPGRSDESQLVWADGIWFANDPHASQWITLTQQPVPLGETVTFRTSFDLTGMVPQSANVEGTYLADDRVVTVRLNGHAWMVGDEPSSAPPFALWRAFRIPPGYFVAGKNCLEFDVHNKPLSSDPMNVGGYLAFRAELRGTAILAERALPAQTPANQPRVALDRSGGK